MGQIPSVFSQSFPPKSRFTFNDIPDLSGKVIIVTGANTGIGKETVKALLTHDAKVYVAARSEEKAHRAIQDLLEATGKEAHFLKLDLSDLQSIKAAAEEFTSKEKELHVLFNNAGVMWPPHELLTADGYDLQFGTNVLGHFYFTKLLLPILISTAKSSPDGHVRVVNSSSMGHIQGRLDFNTFRDGPARKRTNTYALYYQSKFGNVVYATELARRYGDDGIISTSLNPGIIASDLTRYLNPVARFFVPLVLHSVSHGALTQLWAGTSAEAVTFNGMYLIPWARIGEPRPDTQDPEMGKALWTWLEEQVERV